MFPTYFDTALMGRVLPRGQRYVDIADEPVREDPGFERAAYLQWERDDPAFDWDDDDLEWVQVGAGEVTPDILVWVNGVPLEEYLVGLGDSTAPFVDLGHDLPEPIVAHGTTIARHYRLALFRELEGKGGAPCGHGHRRCNSDARYGHAPGFRSANVKAATRAMRVVRLLLPPQWCMGCGELQADHTLWEDGSSTCTLYPLGGSDGTW